MQLPQRTFPSHFDQPHQISSASVGDYPQKLHFSHVVFLHGRGRDSSRILGLFKNRIWDPDGGNPQIVGVTCRKEGTLLHSVTPSSAAQAQPILSTLVQLFFTNPFRSGGVSFLGASSTRCRWLPIHSIASDRKCTAIGGRDSITCIADSIRESPVFRETISDSLHLVAEVVVSVFFLDSDQPIMKSLVERS